MLSLRSRIVLTTLITVTLALAAGAQAAPAPQTSPLWTYSTQGAAAQFGSVYDGELYVSSYDGWVRQLNLHTGALVREWNVTQGNGIAYSAPVKANDGNLYVFAGDNKGLYRLDKGATATAVKVRDYPSDDGMTRVEALGYDSVNDLFFLGTAPRVRAVNSSGVEQWSVPRSNFEWGQPMSNDGYLYTYDQNSRAVYKYDAAIGPGAGGRKWSYPWFAWSANMSKGVDGDGDTLVWAVDWRYGGVGSGGKIVAIYDSGPNAGTKKWEKDLNHTIKHASLWEGHNTLVIPAMNGTVEYRSASTGNLLGSTTLSGGATPDGYSASPWSQVVISGDYAIVSTMDKTPSDPNYLFVIDLKSGTEMWRSDPLDGYPSCMIPILSEGVVVVGTYTAGQKWHAFDLGNGDSVEFSRFGNKYNTGNIPGGLTQLTASYGDANGDGFITDADYTIWADTYLGSGDLRADFNHYGEITAADYAVWMDTYGVVIGGPAPSLSEVPEPASALLLTVGGAVVAWRRRRRAIN